MAGFSAEDLNGRLMEDSGGVDFAALKAKYQRVKQESVSNSKHGVMESLHGQEGGGNGGGDAVSGTGANLASVTTTGLSNSTSSSNSSSKNSNSSTGTNEAIEAFRKLDKYKICNACNGAGVVKYKYNHMVLEKVWRYICIAYI
jgi:hypothetical protein